MGACFPCFLDLLEGVNTNWTNISRVVISVLFSIRPQRPLDASQSLLISRMRRNPVKQAESRRVDLKKT